MVPIHPAPPAPPAPPPPPRAAEPARAMANLAMYVSNDDYPAEAMFNDEEGTTGFRLFIGPNGRVSDCEVTSSSRSASLDEATCRIMRARVRFSPARDVFGRPTEDSVSSRIRWQLARNPDEPIPARARPIRPLASLVGPPDYPAAARRAGAEGATHFSLTVDENGRVGDCVVTIPSGSVDLDAAACAIMTRRARFSPARTPEGAPTLDEHRGHINWRLAPGEQAVGETI